MPNVCLLPTKDLYIELNSPTTNYENNGLAVEVVYVAGTKTLLYRSLITFQIPTEVDDTEIVSAELRLFASAVAAGAAQCTVYRVVRAWTTSATWNTYDGANNWGTAGCSNSTTDYTTTDSLTFNTPSAVNVWATIPITTLVADAINSRSGLLDIKVQLTNENPLSNAGGFYADAGSSGAIAWKRPMLVLVRPPFGKPEYS